jgi:hypothetical protein
LLIPECSLHDRIVFSAGREGSMASNIVLIWIGALLMIAGVLYGAAQALWKGRLSDTRPGDSTGSGVGLEPQQSLKTFSLKTHWPAFALILLGSILILTETAL